MENISEQSTYSYVKLKIKELHNRIPIWEGIISCISLLAASKLVH